MSFTVILCADDDAHGRRLMREALTASGLANELRFVKDGVELLEYLQHRGRYVVPADAPRPGVILMDLNMPRMDGREAARLIKSDPALRSIPIIILTTSKSELDVSQSYDVGANSYIAKPVTFDGLVEVMRTLVRYWFEIGELPSQTGPVRATRDWFPASP